MAVPHPLVDPCMRALHHVVCLLGLCLLEGHCQHGWLPAPAICSNQYSALSLVSIVSRHLHSALKRHGLFVHQDLQGHARAIPACQGVQLAGLALKKMMHALHAGAASIMRIYLSMWHKCLHSHAQAMLTHVSAGIMIHAELVACVQEHDVYRDVYKVE